MEEQDSRFINSGVPKILLDLDALDWCESHPERISETELSELRMMADRLAGDEKANIDPNRLRVIRRRFAALRFGAIDAVGRKNIDHLVHRIDEVIRHT